VIIVKNKRFSGFSLIELLVVVVLLSILSVFALGNLFNQDQFAAKGFFDDTVNAVRFAQKLAISTGCDVRVITSASSYQLLQSSGCIANDFANPVANPANRGNNYQNSSLPASFSLAPATSITFKAWGALDSGNNFTFTVTDGTTTWSFDVYGQTGLVDV
jgi:MSHA pilin protein MshC